MAKEETKGNPVQEFITLQNALFFDLPLTVAKRELGIGTEKEEAEAGWKAYDAWVRLATASVDGVYRDALFGQSVAALFEGFLRWQRLGNALAGAVFAGMGRITGLAAATDVQALGEEMRSHLANGAVALQEHETLLQAAAQHVATENPKAWPDALQALRWERPPRSLPEQGSASSTALPTMTPERAFPAETTYYFEAAAEERQEERDLHSASTNFLYDCEPVAASAPAALERETREVMAEGELARSPLPSSVSHSVTERNQAPAKPRRKDARTVHAQ